jgi:hypothetical protein
VQLLTPVANRPSGLQLSPRQEVTLVSKDVGDERWAIARNADDGSVTGNVFFPSGGNPRFVWCQQTSHAAGNLGFSCQGADACGTSCSASDWTFIADVTLPESFFAPKTKVSEDDLDARVLETLGEDAGFEAVALALDRGYSLAQILHAISDNRLATNGEIMLRSGARETPAGPAHHIFGETQGSSKDRALADGVWDDFQKRFSADNENNRENLVVLLALVSEGYTVDQIVRVVLGGAKITRDPTGVFALYDDKGEVILPNRPPENLIAPSAPPATPTPVPPPTPVPTPPPLCGNGVIDPGEECDGENLNGKTCLTVDIPSPFVGGVLRCSSTRCIFDVSGCIEASPTPIRTPIGPTPPEPHCGNGVKEGSEACDGEDFSGAMCEDFGFASGQLRCKSNCTIDTSGCSNTCPVGGSAAALVPCCGDGVAQGNEQCDGSDLRGATCISLGFAGGTLRCNTTNCRLDKSGCLTQPTPTPPVCEGQMCGNGCIPDDAQCCDGGPGYCPAGRVCVPNGKCCPQANPQACGNLCIPGSGVCCGGVGYCLAGQVCAGNNTACCPPDKPQLCGDQCAPEDQRCCPEGGACPGNLVCTGIPGICCSFDNPQLCGDSCIPAAANCCGGGVGYCPAGHECLNNGMCSADTGLPFAATTSGGAAFRSSSVGTGKRRARTIRH